MNFSPALQKAIEEIAAYQGISPEQFIVQTLTEKILDFRNLSSDSTNELSILSQQVHQLHEKDGILVLETMSLNHIDFNGLIRQLRTERDQEVLCL